MVVSITKDETSKIFDFFADLVSHYKLITICIFLFVLKKIEDSAVNVTPQKTNIIIKIDFIIS